MTPFASLTIDPYVELDVPRDASLQEIKQAYRRIALASHPDRHASDPNAPERFRRASQAYALLRDPQKRLAFDRTGRWEDGAWQPAELDVQLVEALEIFAHDFGAAFDLSIADERAPAHTGRITMSVDVSFEDVERGARRKIPAPCVLCAGSGAREGSAHVRCTACGGSGRLRQVESSFLGPRIHTERCDGCHGSGRRPILVCAGCDGSGRTASGETIDVLIPRGTADGDTLTSMKASGLRFIARLVEDQRWARDGADLYATERIPYALAVLGGPLAVQLPGRTYTMQVAAATASGQRLRIPGQGLPAREGSGRGDLILTLHVTVPERVGTLERWLLALRSGRTFAGARTGLMARVTRAHAWARSIAVRHWQEWREHYHRSSLSRIEKTAASLRTAAALLTESEERLGPLLEQGFPAIAPEAARARGRLEGARIRYAALAEFVVDSALVAGLGLGLWLLALYAVPAISATGDSVWWGSLGRIDPVAFAFLPLLAGLGAGALRGMDARRWVKLVFATPCGIAVGTMAAATGTAVHATIMNLAPPSEAVLFAVLGVVAALSVGIASISLFLLGDTLVESARKAVREAADRADKLTLQKYDVTAARLGSNLEATEHAFRQLLTQADDARHPLGSLLNGAADTLAERQRHFRSRTARALLALGGAVAITIVWIASTFVAAVTAYAFFPSAALLAFGTAAATTALCTIGILLPPSLLERHHTLGMTTAVATLLAVVALAGMLVTGAHAGWLAAGGAAAALTLSFRLPDSIRATGTALTIAGAGALSLLLWPVALVALARGSADH